MKSSLIVLLVLLFFLSFAIPMGYAFEAVSQSETFGRPQPIDVTEFTEAQERLDELMIALADKDSAEERSQGAGQAEDERNIDENQAGSPQIADPLAPFNRVVFHFNDKLYFWGVKPVAQVYSHIVPEEFRFAFANAYDNLWSPARVVNNLLQLRLKAAGNEFVRFAFNSFAGIGGMGDMADQALGIKKQDADFGQTLGHYGIGHGIYLVLPVFGPSSIRDGIGLVGDRLMHPLTYVKNSNLTFGEKVGIAAHERLNATSFRIGDYESFKEAAIDPYVSMRDAFVQNRQKAVEESNR
ncbi:MAG TPA: VacJ family lipoprotein [Dissulfurispiraceae bacterium]|nr:VacJ family lipoprotein [Dissulfurispiraceae bacterium]